MKPLLFALGGTLAAVAVIEIGLRQLDPFGSLAQAENGALYQGQVAQLDTSSPRVFRHRPNTTAQMRGHTFNTDSRGLRNEETAQPKPDGTRRIFFLGDSVVLGWGVGAESTFVRFVEQSLNETCPDTTWETINGGHLLHDTTQEQAVLEEVGESYQPDMVALVFVDNDIVLTRNVQTAVKAAAPSPEAEKYLKQAKRLARIQPYLPGIYSAASYWMAQSNAFARKGSSAHAKAMGLSLEEGWIGASEALLNIRDWCNQRSIEFIVLDNAREGPLHDKLLELCEEQAIRYGTVGFTKEDRLQDVRNSRSDAHANELGHRIISSYILEHLRETQLFTSSCQK